MAGIKLPNNEIEKRVQECYTLRFENDNPFRYKDWIEYCHKEYDDKSEQQYGVYWSKSKDLFTEGWKEKLDKLLEPAADKISELLYSDNPHDHKEAIKMIFKYTGNEVEKKEINASITEIRVGFTSDEQ